MKTPILSILIPTKNRYETLMPVLSGLVKDFDDLDVEFIVQDNSDENSKIHNFIKSLNCDKIKYFHENKTLSQSENCNYSVKNSKGRFLILIGDDDYVLPSIINAIKWMKKNNVECLNYNIASYLWNDIAFKYKTSVSSGGTLLINKPINKKFKLLNPKIELNKVIESGGTDYANLPRLYHGLVRRDVMDQVYKQCGTYFPGLSPDMASSVAISIFTKAFYKYNYPLSISGKSFFSAAGKGVNHTHIGDLNKMKFLDKRLLKSWNKNIPYFWSGDTIYAQSIIHSLIKCGKKDLKINFNRLYAHLLIFERKSISKKMGPIFQSISNDFMNLFYILFWYIIYFFSRSINFIYRKVYPSKLFVIHKSIYDIKKCVNLIEEKNIK